ncbi:MAG: hypothetical protein KIT11_07960 [Fimbriimonadaceae bacterium]|nr:hypothetical protein [Fimbriimonadaceae bacterium]QYK56288.1 MAG: hypothetical protein KF733_02155 [Fimbriimonadaceae bacterium]
MNRLLALLLPLGLAIAGCGTGEVARIQPHGRGGATPVESPKEKLEEQRMADATRGLVITNLVRTQTNQPADRAKAINLTAKADEVYQIENSWFLSVGAYRDAVLADPSYAPAYVGMGNAFLLEGKTDHAKAAYRTALAKDAKNLEAGYQLGLVAQMDGDYRGAVAQWRGVVSLTPTYKDTFARMALASYFAEDYDAAWTYLNKAKGLRQDIPAQFEGLLREASKKA